MLCIKTEVFECIHYFVSLEIVMELSKLYVERLKDNKLKEVMHHQNYRANNKGCNIKFLERSLFHKIARVVYKFMRSIFSRLNSIQLNRVQGILDSRPYSDTRVS